MSKFIYGIDFGTTNSVIATFDVDSNKIVQVFSEASIIYFKDSKEIYVGNEAINHFLLNGMKGRLLKSLKTILPQSSFHFTYIYGKKYTPEDLVCLILLHLKNKADKKLGFPVKEVVLGRPAVFSEDPEKDNLAERRLLMAAQKAGFEKIYFQYEPIAAGFLFEQKLEHSEMVLIGDFGGGTSDFTIMKLGKEKIGKGDRRNDILKTGGLHIGGDDFDAAIMWNKLVTYFGYGVQYESYGKMLDLPVQIFRTLCEWDQMAFLKEGNIRKRLDTYYLYTNKHPAIKRLMLLIDQNLGFSLFQSIERSKIALSDNKEAAICFFNDSIEINENINEEEFNNFIRKEINSIHRFIDTFLEEASLEKVHHVFLTGGTSSIKGVRKVFEDKVGKEKILGGDNFNSVAQGLALSYSLVS